MSLAKKGLFGLLALLLGLALALAFAEAAMRAAARLIVLAQSRSNPKINLLDPREFRVVALGESTTAQFWSKGRDESWPGQLQQMLNDAGLGRRFKIINLARGGTSSAFQVAEFEDRLDALHPHAVISMLGINDTVPYSFLHDRGWRSLQIVKLARWLRRSFVPRKPLAAPRLISGRNRGRIMARLQRELDGLETASPRAIEAAQRKARAFAAAQGGDDWYALSWASHLFFDAAARMTVAAGGAAAARKRRLALVCFDLAAQALEKNPTDAETATFLGYAGPISDKREEAVSILRRSLEIGLQPDSTLLTILPELALRDPRILTELEARGLAPSDDLNWYWKTFDNYRRLADTARARGIVFLAMQYPTGKVSAIKNLFSRSPDLSYAEFKLSLYGTFPRQDILPEYGDVIFIGNEIFDDLVATDGYGEYFVDRFAADRGGRFGHTTYKGHSVIARNAARAIIERWPEISAAPPRAVNFPIIRR